MKLFVRRRLGVATLAAGLVAGAGVAPLGAQGADGTIAGHVVDGAKRPVAGAVVVVVGTRLGAYAGSDGSYSIEHIPAGPVRVATRLPGFIPDTVSVTVAAGQTVPLELTIRSSNATLSKVVVTASPRLNETKEAAIAAMKNADNIKYVESGDDIRALPSLNAAEAAERIPGVTTERDEGEGKFVQIRGTEPKLQNVTIDGVHIPGTLSGDRSVKLDNIPSDLIGAIEVSKTLSADQDADAIGGSVNFVSKIPETAPRGYISGLFGVTTLENRNAGQFGGTYGGRFGANQKLGLLLGVSYDRNDRPINDVEPSWNANALHTGFYPSSFDQRDYFYFRQRYGANADIDYRFDAKTSVYVRGLFGRFLNHGYRYVWNVSANTDSVAGASRPLIGTAGTSARTSENRTPTENTYGFTTGIKKDDLGPFHFDAAAQLGGSSSIENDYRTSVFNYVGSNVAYQYNNSNVLEPRYTIYDPKQHADMMNPANFVLNSFGQFTSRAVATEVGGVMNFLLPYAIGDLPASTKFGGKIRNLTKTYDNNGVNSTANPLAPITMAQLQGSLTTSNFYSQQFPGGVNLGPFPSQDRTTVYENSHPGQLIRNPGDAVANKLSEYFGNERVTAAYVMQTLDVSRLHMNVGLRLENTYQEYRGHADTVTADYNSQSTGGIVSVTGRHTYNDLFPSMQLRYAIDDNTNARFAFTRGIARADYTALAPTTTGTPNAQLTGPINQSNSVSIGNPKLKAETAWNYDLLFEHYLPAAGVISAGVFYKDLHNIVFNRRFFNYQGPILAYQGQNGVIPLNASGGHLIGWEVDWEQHFTFLPGALSGFGFDVNWTHTTSYTRIPSTDSVPTYRRASLFRTSPDIGNISGLYAYGPISARVAWVYQGPNVNAYGSGTSDPTTGDNYFYAHAQLDGSLYVNLTNATQFQFQALNLNDAVFGFFNGTTKHQFDTQREYYGRTFYFGLRQSF